VSGTLSPAEQNAVVTVTYSYGDPKLGPQAITDTVVTDAKGDYQDTVKASVAGPWTTVASFAGDQQLQASTAPGCTTSVQ
jgi:hypothetical protein